VSKVSLKKRGWRSTVLPSPGMALMRSWTQFLTCSKFWDRLEANCGLSRARECFQGAPSWVKMPLPKRGLKCRARRPRP
jgi:hypothetical protein